MWSAKIFTLYPEFFPGILDIGLYKRARENKIWSLDVINIRDYALDKHGSVDDSPFGGGSGMVMRADVIDNCLDKNTKNSNNELIYLSPRGELLTQKIAKQLSKKNGVDLICGHFEGIDQRVIEERKIREISIGDFILSGGETAAFVFLDSILRLLPGVLGN
ncbi:MAG: tRNA (guanine(37)-N(1))-methyltransferase, partial [Candidatus Fonsibacter sp.]